MELHEIGVKEGKWWTVIEKALMQKNKKCETLYVDTEGGFQTSRICDIAAASTPEMPFQPPDSLRNIRVNRCRDLVELTSTIHSLEMLVNKNPK
ncbi:unnamed protein product, partial [Gongylonema pulchrum]|uniref:RECA_2 domain-containing protein n=1 Tax=Gongylonema pulchrum TaxID=637853 RepID=A0A183DLB8_9BILA